MTTQVIISVNGNKKVAVRVSGSPAQDCLMQPGTSASFSIHGDHAITIAEHDEWSQGVQPQRPIPNTGGGPGEPTDK